MHNLSWGLLPYVLYTYRRGTVSGAAEDLNLTHATVIRGLKKLENETGTKLFIKSRSGYVPTETGMLLIETAKRIEGQIGLWRREVTSGQKDPTGRLRITTTQEIFKYIIAPILNKYYQQYPKVLLEFDTTYKFNNITNNQFDIALRSTYKPPEHLVGRKLKELSWAVYQNRALPESNRNWIGFNEVNWHPTKWLNKEYPHANIISETSSIIGNLELVKAGLGKSILPCFVAETLSELKVVEQIPGNCSTQLWLIYHQESRYCAKVHSFVTWLSGELRCRTSDLI